MTYPNALQTLIDDFSLFSDWEERYQYLIDLGKTLPPLDNALKTDATLVKGCTSRVWMVDRVHGGIYSFTADSDAHIVRGLIAILYATYNNVAAADIQSIDIHSAFKAMGLDQNLSPNRRNGFWSMVEQVQKTNQHQS